MMNCDEPEFPSELETKKLFDNEEMNGLEILGLKIMRIPKIQFAPLLVSWERRLQTLGVFYFFTLTLQTQLIMLLSSFNVLMWPLLLMYGFFMLKDKCYENGGRPSQWYRSLRVWNWFIDYFPMKIVKEAELDPNRNYIFGYHPHGVIAVGACGAFGTEGLDISKVYPGIKTQIVTLGLNFKIPLYREIALWTGCVSSSKESIGNVFKKGPGHSVLIAIGGAEEALHSASDSTSLVLARRKGFVKLALTQGASLVPMYSFGENKLFDVLVPSEGSIIRFLQNLVKKILGFTIPLYSGRGLFTYNYGHLPKRHPITIVSGAPILVEKDSHPSEEKIDALHHQYLMAIQDLYRRNKVKYGDPNLPDLMFI